MNKDKSEYAYAWARFYLQCHYDPTFLTVYSESLRQAKHHQMRAAKLWRDERRAIEFKGLGGVAMH